MANVLLIKAACQEYNIALNAFEELKIPFSVIDHYNSIDKIIKKQKITLTACFVGKTPGNVPEKIYHYPIHLPMLIIGSNPADMVVYLKNSPSRLTDFIQTPFTKELLLQKINFLDGLTEHLKELDFSHKKVEALQQKITELNQSVEGHNSFLELMSRRDGLTGLFNRRHFNTAIHKYFSSTLNNNQDVSLVFLNIDYFNEINKSCGQDYGDFVLNELSARITSCTGDNDICFRLSGEEFAVIMVATSLAEALEKAEKLKSSCKNKLFDNGYFSKKVTVSIGVVSLRTHKPKSHDEFINMADQALFLAKSEGRDRVIQYTPFDKSSFGTTEQNFKILQDTLSRILDKTKVSTLRSLQLLAQGIMKGKETEQIKKTQDYAELLSRQLHFPTSFTDTFRNSTILLNSIRYLLHNEVINKSGKLSSNEWQVITDLPYKLDQIINLFDYFSGERTLLLYHGEKYDGSGYPEGLKGEEIPVGSRIFNLVSAVAAMNSDRPYRKKLPPQQILAELTDNAGKQFDPFLVMKLIDVIEEKGILKLDKENLDKSRKIIKNSLKNHVKK